MSSTSSWRRSCREEDHRRQVAERRQWRESTRKSGCHGDRCIRGEARRHFRENATESGTNADLKSDDPVEGPTRVFGIRDIRVAFFRAAVGEEMYVRMSGGFSKPVHVTLLRRALHGTRQASWLVDRALKELQFVHLVVVLRTYFHVHHFLSES